MQRLKVFAWIATLDRFQKAMLLAAASLGGIALLIVMGGLLATGAIVATIFVSSAIFSLSRLPSKMRTWLLQHPIITNILATTSIGLVVGVGSVTGLVTCAMTFLGVDIAQKIATLAATPEEEQPRRIIDTQLVFHGQTT